MPTETSISLYRRKFLTYLASSPLFATVNFPEMLMAAEEATANLIANPEEALNVFDLHDVAKNILPPAHYGFVATGVDDDLTLQANRDGFSKFYLRPKRIVDVSNVDTSIKLFGDTLRSPFMFCPIGGHRTFNPLGEIATASAVKTRDQHMILSTVTSTAIEQVIEARGKPIWYQLYPSNNWEVTKGLLKRVEAAGCPVVALTVDLPGKRNTETHARYTRLDTRDCSACHQEERYLALINKPMFKGLPFEGANDLRQPRFSWDMIKRIQDQTNMKLLLKGILTREDAELSVEHGVDGIIVSNHGGRAAEAGIGTIEMLPEIIAGVDGRIPVLIDSGFRRGTDIFKALAMGATAVAVGRPYIWGLAAFGQPGVEKVIDILNAELLSVMHLNGTPTIKDINSSRIGRFVV